MIEFTSTMTIRGVNLKSKTKDGVTVRRVRLTIEREFDDDLAASLGPDAKRIRKLLSDGAMVKSEIPLDAIEAQMKIKNVESGRLRIDSVKGVRAMAKAPPSVGAEMPPSIALLWDFGFSDEAIVFLANALGQTVSIEISPRQLELIKNEKERSPIARAKAAATAGTLTRDLVDECVRYVEKRGEKLDTDLRAALARFKLVDGAGAPADDGAPISNPVLTPERAGEFADDDHARAATPEDAEADREARLREQRAALKRDTEALEHGRFSEETIAAADEGMAHATTETVEDDRGPYVVAKLESPTHVMECDGDDRDDALANLRRKLLETLHSEGGSHVVAATASAAPKVGLQVPKGVKAPKSHKGGSADPK